MFTDLFSTAVLVVVTILILPAITGLITILKDVGMPARLAPLVAVILGVTLMIAYAQWGDNRYFLLGLLGVLVGMAACGRYDLSKLAGASIPPATITVDDSWITDDDQDTSADPR